MSIRQLLFVIAASVASTPAAAQHAVTWHEMSSGGGGRSAGGGYTLTGSIGQPDAGVNARVFTLTGGFLSSRRVEQLGCNDADLADPFGVLNFNDVVVFLEAFVVSDPISDLSEPIGVFDFSDVLEFLTQFGAGCP